MLDEVKQLYHRVRETHAESYALVVTVRNAMAGTASTQEYVDTIFACKRAEGMIDDLGKELRKLMDTYKRLCCLMWTAEMTGEPIRTQYCTGSPDTKVTYLVPKRGTQEYRDFCTHYGVDPDGPFTPHWKKMIDSMSELAKQGLPPPPGINVNESITVFDVSVRQKAGASIDKPTRMLTKEQLENALTQVVNDSMALQLEEAMRRALQDLPYATLSLAERRALIRDAAVRLSQACSDDDLA